MSVPSLSVPSSISVLPNSSLAIRLPESEPLASVPSRTRKSPELSSLNASSKTFPFSLNVFLGKQLTIFVLLNGSAFCKLGFKILWTAGSILFGWFTVSFISIGLIKCLGSAGVIWPPTDFALYPAWVKSKSGQNFVGGIYDSFKIYVG